MRHWLAALLLLISWVPVDAQVSGVVVDSENGMPVGGVMVKAIVEGKTKAFATTNTKGEFNIPKAPLPCILTFSHLSYDRCEVKATNSNPITYRLSPSTRELVDVLVEAPRIVQKGDTTTYHLGRFVTKRDVTVQDALKKLPGVEVSKGGTISYLGKAIDKLTIDGMDMLGKDYQSTIQSLSHNKIERVEIMENQQDVKMLKDLVGDDKIVMNLVLNRRARGRANGKAEVGAGIDSHEEIAYRGMGHLLYVQPRWQTTLEGRIEKDFNATDEVKPYVIPPLMPSSPLLNSLPVGLSAPEPTVSPHFYLRQRGGQGKLKSVYQLASDHTINANLSYSDYTGRHTYGNELTFLTPLGNDNIQLNENRVDIRSREQIIRGDLEYKRNEQANYLNDEIEYVGLRRNQQDDILRTHTPSNQEVDQRSHLVRNSLSWSKRNGSNVFSWGNTLSFQSSPLLSLTSPEIEQKFREQLLEAKLFTSFQFPLTKGWRLSFPISLSYDSDIIYKEGVEFTQGTRWDIALTPNLWKFSQGENNISFSMATTLALMKYGKSGLATRLLLSPSINYMYRFNRVWSVSGSLSYNQKAGSLLDLLRVPYYASYRQEVLGSGTLTNTQSGNLIVSFSFRKPIQELYGAISLFGNYSYNDHLFADNPSEGLNRIELVRGDNTSGSYRANAYVSRFFRKSKTKVSMGISATYAHYESIRREIKQKSKVTDLSTWGEVQFNLSEHWSGTYHCSAACSQMRYAAQQLPPLHSLTNKIDVTYSPTDYLHLTLSGEHQGKELRAKEMKHLFLLSAVGEYRSHLGNFKLHLHNLLNMQEYGFARYSATESNRSWYQLRGRSALLSYTFYF